MNFSLPVRVPHFQQVCSKDSHPSIFSENSTFDPRGPFDSRQCRFLLVHVMSGHQLPASPGTRRDARPADRRLHVQVRVSGVEAEEQRERTKAVKNNGETQFTLHVPRVCRWEDE